MELLDYFDRLPEEAHNALLESLHMVNEFKSSKPKKNLDDYMSEMVDKLPSKKACLYDEFMEAQCQQATAKKYKGKLPSCELKSGLQITLVTCNAKDIGVVKVILCKQDCSDDQISCKKTQDKVVKFLDTQLLAGNSSHVLTSVDADGYDIAVDLLSWQSLLKSIQSFWTQYDT
jgi:hypothetical protein